jgi:hypothetical protein
MSHLVADLQGMVTAYFPYSGLLLQSDKHTGRARTSIDTWPDLESATRAFTLGEIKWREWIE